MVHIAQGRPSASPASPGGKGQGGPGPKNTQKASDRPSPEVDDPEILDTGQEEVFSRTEVELGRTEHKAKSGDPKPAKASPKRA